MKAKGFSKRFVSQQLESHQVTTKTGYPICSREIKENIFKDLNDLLDGIILSFNDDSMPKNIDYTISDMTCFNINIGNIKVDSSIVTKQTHSLLIDVKSNDFDRNS